MKSIRQVDFGAPVRTVSESNSREHWAVRNRRKREQQELIAVAMQNATRGQQIELPCQVTLTRIGPRRLDSHDNLRSCFKGIVDQICKKLNVDDGSDQVRFEYTQMPNKSRNYSVKIAIRSL